MGSKIVFFVEVLDVGVCVWSSIYMYMYTIYLALNMFWVLKIFILISITTIHETRNLAIGEPCKN